MSYFLYPIITVSSLLILYRFFFLRNPRRRITAGDNIIVSPADGRVVKIIKYDHEKNLPSAGRFELREKKLGKVLVKTADVSPRGWLVVIMMNIHNMHRQKAPMNGEVLSVKYTKGKFFNAIRQAHNMRATLENESNEILLKTQIGNIKVVQVAGLLAKKIVCAVKAGQSLAKGENLGLIKLGSQVIVVLPEGNIELKISEKMKVKAGLTVIAEIRQKGF